MVKTYGWVLCLVFLGCGSTDVMATGAKVSPRPESCDFDVLTSLPMSGYREIGTIDVTPGGYGANQFTSLSDFKEHIREDVCQLGGDAAFASANGFGLYIKASVLQRVAVPAPRPSAVAAAEPPKSKPAGCEFDTQCKGDRICVDGKCVAPEPKASAPAEATPVAPIAAPPTASAAAAPVKAPPATAAKAPPLAAAKASIGTAPASAAAPKTTTGAAH